MKKLLLLSLVFALFGFGCGDDEISGGPLSGKLGGKSWTFQGGVAKRGGPDGLTITLAGYVEEDPCAIFAYDEIPNIWWFAPDEPTERKLGLRETVVFQVADDEEDTFGISKNVTKGKYTIDIVGPDTVSGGLLASGFGDSVDGQWEVPLCD